MTQLSINGIDLPETKNGKYKCYEQELGVIEYSYDYMGNDLMRRLLTALRSRSDLSVQFLDPLSDSMQSALFRCTKQPTPQFAFSRDGVGLWNNIAFTLEEVEGS